MNRATHELEREEMNMGFFSWFNGKSLASEQEEETASWPSDFEVASRLAALLRSHLYLEPGGLAQLMQPTCAVVLHSDGSVALLCPSSPPFVHSIVSFIFLHELPAFKRVVNTLSAFSKLEEKEVLIEAWIMVRGPTEGDAIVAEALCQMKSNAKLHVTRAKQPLSS